MPPKKSPKPIAPSRPLKRRPAKNSPLPKVYIYTEGKLTEPEYINKFYLELCKKKRVILAPIVRAAGVPFTMVTACVAKVEELRREARRDPFLKNSVVWAVFDVDVHPRLAEAIALAERNGVRCAVSNPCIEVWGLMHSSIFERPSSRFDAQAELARVMPGYHHDDSPIFPWDRCKDFVDVAIENSIKAKLRREAEGGRFPACNPTTTFYELLIALRGDAAQ